MDRSSSRVITAVLVAVISIPLSTQAIFRSQDQDGRLSEDVTNIHSAALEYRTKDWPLIRRAYSRAMQNYRLQVRQGNEKAVLPNINDFSTFKAYLDDFGVRVGENERRPTRTTDDDGERVKGLIDFKPEDAVYGIEVKSSDRNVLRQYTRIGYCPPSLEEVARGFYKLCLSVIGRRYSSDDLPKGLSNDLQGARARLREPASIKLRLQMIEDSKANKTKRDGGGIPGRPTPYIQPTEE